MKIMIHACPERMWYVKDYLVPSLKTQGIKQVNITVWNDTAGDGCLVSCLKSFASCDSDGATWHLQDDVLIAHDFAERAEELDKSGYNVVHGFCHTLFEPFNRPMLWDVPAIFAFNSFPCIRIPNSMAREFVRWVYDDASKRPEYKNWIRSGKHDDSLWHDFFVERYPHERCWNEAPALVEHVDWLIGGSTVNAWRGYICRASYWEDEYLIEDLKRKLARH